MRRTLRLWLGLALLVAAGCSKNPTRPTDIPKRPPDTVAVHTVNLQFGQR